MLRLLLPILIVCGCLAESVNATLLPEVKSVRIGFDNHYKNGLWTPITVEFHEFSKAGDIVNVPLKIQCSDSDGTPITYYYTVSIVPGEKATVLAKLGRKDEPIQISFNGGEFQTFEVPPPVNAERPIYLIIGNEDIGLQGAVAELMLREDRRPLLVKVKSLADLPDRWFGYEAIEMVVLTTTEPQLFEGLTSNSPQMRALDDWVKLGGKMLLCAGKDAGPFLEPEDGALRLFLPGEFAEMTELRSGTRFESFVNSKRQIFMNGTDEAPFMKMPRFTNPRGITFMSDGDLPLVLRAAHGLGTIIYFGGDLSERPLVLWRDRVALVRSIMQWDTTRRTAVDPRAGAMLQLGYNDISGQIRSALDQFEGVRIVPFSIILIILTAYWLVIGLFDWFFVHKVLKRPILTWVTFPLWIVLFSVLTYALAAPGRPSVKQWNILEIWDVDKETETYRHSLWMTQYSEIDRKLGGTFSIFGDGYYSWNGLPGSGLGGMAPKTVSPPVWQVGSEQIDYGRITNVPIQTRSTKSFFGQFNRDLIERVQQYGQIIAQLSDDEGVPVGTIEIPDGFSFSLKNCILVYGRWVLELGDIQPGQTMRLTRATFTNTMPQGATTTAVPRRDLRELLIPPRTRENENLRGMATYNPQSTDLEYIVRVMSLYRVLGGYESTGLHHAYQPSLDMSELLTADRVLLIGVVVPRGADSLSLFAGNQTHFFRQSFPITLTALSPRLNMERYSSTPEAEDPLQQRMQKPGFTDGSGIR